MAGETIRDKELKALKEANTLKEKVDQEAHNQAIYQEREKRLQTYRMKESLKDQKRAEGFSQTQQETSEHLQQVNDSRKQASRYPLQQHNVASLIMEMEPRFAALGRFFTSLQKQLVQEYLTDNASAFFWKMSEPTAMPKIPKDKKIDIPDLKYFVKINENGILEADFVPACIKNFLIAHDDKGNELKDKDGNYRLDSEKALVFQLSFQKGVEAWLDQKDYFTLKEGNKFRVYPKRFGKEENGTWVLDPKQVEQHYDLNDCDYDGVMKTYTPKPNARSRTGVPMYLEEAAFERLKNDSSHGPNLGHFLENYFDGLVQQYEDENEPDNGRTLGMSP